MEITSRKVTIFVVGAKVSSQSTPSSCAYSLTIRKSLYLSTEPSDLYLTLKIHLQRIAFFPRGNVDNTQVLFFIYASYFTFMAAFNSSFPFESSNVLGSNTWNKINRSERKISCSLPHTICCLNSVVCPFSTFGNSSSQYPSIMV